LIQPLELLGQLGFEPALIAHPEARCLSRWSGSTAHGPALVVGVVHISWFPLGEQNHRPRCRHAKARSLEPELERHRRLHRDGLAI
jgi:hypothetical protein